MRILLCLATAALASCTDEELQPSVAELIIGEYYLAEVSGGITGMTEVYLPGSSPAAITFSEEGTYTYVAAGADAATGEWFMTQVARANDTLSFRFTNQLPGPFRGAAALLIDGERLVLPPPPQSSDVPTAVYLRR